MAALLVRILAFSMCAWVLVVSADKVRPCENNLTNACVGSYLSSSGCSLDNLPDSSDLDPYSLDHFYFETLYFNITEDRTNITITGVNQTYVKDLFYNTTSGRAVLTLVYPYVRFEGDTVLHYYYTPGEEPINITTHYQVTFTNMTLTTIFNDYENPTLENSQTFPYLPNEPTYNNGDGLQNASLADSRVAFLVEEYGRLPYVATLEAFQYRGPALVNLFTNYKLCRYEA